MSPQTHQYSFLAISSKSTGMLSGVKAACFLFGVAALAAFSVFAAGPASVPAPSSAAAPVSAPAAPGATAAAAPSDSAAASTRAQAPEEIRAHAQNKVFQLLTRVADGAEKRSYGTAFVVDPHGWLITNFHVVAAAVLEPSKYVTELKIENVAKAARVFSYDIGNDLALVRVENTFTDAYRLATRVLVPGEKLYSIGLPQDTVMTIIEGLFSDLRRSGPISRIFLSAPLNAGMSGGPVVNAYDELVGVNDAMLRDAQNISIAVPGEAVATLVANVANGRSPAATAPANEVRDQIGATLFPWLSAWNVRTGTKLSLNGASLFGRFFIAEPPIGMKCWEDVRDVASVGPKLRMRICQNPEAFPITGSGRMGGHMDIRYQQLDAKSQRLTSLVSAGRWVGLLKSQTSGQFDRSSLDTEASRSARFVCHHRFTRNSRGLPLLAEYCVADLPTLAGVFDTVLTIVPLSEGHSSGLLGEMVLHGFTERETLLASQTFMDGITESPGSAVAN